MIDGSKKMKGMKVLFVLVAIALAAIDHRAQCEEDPQHRTALKFVNETRYELTFFIDGEEKCRLEPSSASQPWLVDPGEHQLAARAIVSGIPFLLLVINDVPEGQVCTWTVANEEVARPFFIEADVRERGLLESTFYVAHGRRW